MNALKLFCFKCIAFILLIPYTKCASRSDDSTHSDNACENRDFIIISTVDGVLTAVDINTGKKCWSVLLDPDKFISSTLSNLELFEEGKRVYLVPSLDGGLYKYDKSKNVVQVLPLDVDSLVSHTAFLDSSTSVIGGKIKIMHAINRGTGEIIYTCGIDSCNKSKNPIPEDSLIVEEVVQFINAVDSSKGEFKWHFRVVELKIIIPSQVSNGNSAFYSNQQENGLIPHDSNNFVNVDCFRVSLQNGFAGKIDESTKDFAWLFKVSSPINDAWHLRGSKIKVIDPFRLQSGFYSVETEDGRNSWLFLGIYQEQMYIKRSRKAHMENMNFNSLSKDAVYQTYFMPLSPDIPTLPPALELNDTTTAVTPTNVNYNVSGHGGYYFMNFSIFENATHCMISGTTTIVYQEIVSPKLTWYEIFMPGFFLLFVWGSFVYLHERKKKENREKEMNARKRHLTPTPAVTPPPTPDSNPEFMSRFYQDFELISVLGKGGFGLVMDAKNKIDDCHYAVKRIRLKGQLNDIQYGKVLREVKALAKLDHHGIVRYFNAWIEYPPEGWQEEKDKESNIKDVLSFSTYSDTPEEQKFSIFPEVSSKPKYLERLNQNPFQLNDELASFSVHPSSKDTKFSEQSSSFGSNKTLSGNKSHSSYNFQKKKEDSSRTSLDDSEASGLGDNGVYFVNSFEKCDYDAEFGVDHHYDADDFIVFEESQIGNISKIIKLLGNSYSKENGYDNSRNPSVSFIVSDQHMKCSDDLRTINRSMINPVTQEDFQILCFYIFYESPISEESDLNMLKLEKILHEITKERLLFYQKWFICILCQILSPVNKFSCDVAVKNICCILSDIDKELALLTRSHKSSLKISKLSKSDKEEEIKQNDSPKLPRGYLYIQMQLCQKESLSDWLYQHSTNREYDKVMEIFCELVDAVHYVHNCGLMHRDLKPSNIYFSLEGAVKIGDFGLATSSDLHAENNPNNQSLSDIHTSDIGTELYMSPEQKLMQDYDSKTDIYSLGIILFELLVPFKTHSERFQVLTRVRDCRFPDGFKRDFKHEGELVQLLLKEDPKQRPTTNDIKNHPLFSKYTSAQK